MNLNEMFEPVPDGYQDLDDDSSTIGIGDLRKSRLTLIQLNKLRRMQEVRAYEKSQKSEKIKAQYSSSEGGGGGMEL